jgi:hypothetical protein
MTDIVRVLRIIEYVGPRNWVEATVAGSIHGERQVTLDGKLGWIRAATIGTYPEILHNPDLSQAPNRDCIYAMAIFTPTKQLAFLAGPVKGAEGLLDLYISRPELPNAMIIDITGASQDPTKFRVLYLWSESEARWVKDEPNGSTPEPSIPDKA